MFIAGEEVVCSNQLTIVEELTNTNTLVLNNCYPLSWEQTKDYTQFYTPKDYSLFKLVYDYSDYNLTTENGEDILTEVGEEIIAENSLVTTFIGVIKRSQSIDLRPFNPHYATLQVLDFKTFLNEGDLFNFVITETTVGDFINQVVGEYSGYNFVVGNLNLGDKLNQTVGNYSCDQKTLFDVLQYISQITNSIWKARYVNDTTFAIDFYDINSLPQGMDLVYDNNYFNDNSIVDITYSFNTNNYRNKQVITSSNIIAQTINTEEFYTNSSDNKYQLSNNVGAVYNATLDGNEISIASNVDKQNGITADLYYTVGSNEIELNIDALPTQRLYIQYDPMIPGRVTVLNTSEIDRIGNQLNNTGIISRYEQRQDATTAEELNAIGQTYIQFKGKPEITLQVKTINKDLWKIGEIVYFDNNNIDGLIDLVGTYAVKKKTTQMYQNNADDSLQVFFTYELDNNYNFENLINYFDNQRAKTIGNIQEGQFINKYIENTEAINIIFDEPVIGGA
jgi:hypothetical protein